MLKSMLRRTSALLAAGGMLLSSGAALAAPPEPPAYTIAPVWDAPQPVADVEVQTEPKTPEIEQQIEQQNEPKAPIEQQIEQNAPVEQQKGSKTPKALVVLPPEGGAVTLTGAEVLRFEPEGRSVVIAAPPGDYTIACGERTAQITLDAQGSVTVHSGAASWDGEQLTLGGHGTLELRCRVTADTQTLLTVETVAGTHTLPLGYDPQMDDGTGCVITHRLTLPAGTVSVTIGGIRQEAALSAGQTLRLEF